MSHVGAMDPDRSAHSDWMDAFFASYYAHRPVNATFLGAAVMYLMGTDAILGLRQEMTEREGSDFDLGRFHDTFLSYGSIPVSLIAEDMKRSAP